MKHIALAVCLIAIYSCSVNRREPDWVLSYPSDNAYYSAVVRVSKMVPDYVQLARENALKDISTQISVQIESSIAINETERGGIPSADLVSQIRSSSSNKLSNVQLVGTHQNDKDYWAYYRLSKGEYRAWRVQQRNIAIQQALDLMSGFDQAETDAVHAISKLLKALDLVMDFADMELTTFYQGKAINLYNELYFRLQSLTQRWEGEFKQQQLAVVAKQRQKYSIPITVLWQKGGNRYPCSSFPLLFSFASGAGNIEQKTITNYQGEAYCTIHRITDFRAMQQIILHPDKEYWLSAIENPLVKKLFTQLKFTPDILVLQVSRPKAFIDYSFDNTAGTILREGLAKKLQDLDLEVVPDKSSSHFVFRITVNSREGEYIPRLNLYSAIAYAFVELLDSTGKNIYSTNLTGIKSTGNTKDAARKAIEQSSINDICNKLLFMMVEQHIMN